MDQKTAAQNDQLLRIHMGDPVWLVHTGKTLENKNGKISDVGEVEDGHTLTLGWMGGSYEVQKGQRVMVPRRCAIHHVNNCLNNTTPKIRLKIEEAEKKTAEKVQSAAERRAALEAELEELKEQEKKDAEQAKREADAAAKADKAAKAAAKK